MCRLLNEADAVLFITICLLPVAGASPVTTFWLWLYDEGGAGHHAERPLYPAVPVLATPWARTGG